jgi:hypothetical protein
LRDEQQAIVGNLIKYYVHACITDYENFKEFRQEKLMLEQYDDVVKRIEKDGATNEK